MSFNIKIITKKILKKNLKIKEVKVYFTKNRFLYQLYESLLNRGFENMFDIAKYLIKTQEHLSLSGCMFGEFDGKMFASLVNLRVLELDSNRLTKFDAGPLDLVELDVSANQLTVIELQNQKNLVELNLSSNRLESVPTLTGLVSLKCLRLDKNQIDQIESQQFDTLTNLSELNLSKNRITELNEDCFTKLVNLVELNLSMNQLESIPISTFQCLKRIERLKLNSNKIETIESEHFKDLKSLVEVDLSKNKIKDVEIGAFDDSKYLKIVNLSSNLLTYIDTEQLFGHLSSLHELWIDNNKLIEVCPKVFERLPEVKLISISHNNNIAWKPFCLDSSVFEYLKLKLGLFMDSEQSLQDTFFSNMDMFISQFSIRGKH